MDFLHSHRPYFLMRTSAKLNGFGGPGHFGFEGPGAGLDGVGVGVGVGVGKLGKGGGVGSGMGKPFGHGLGGRQPEFFMHSMYALAAASISARAP